MKKVLSMAAVALMIAGSASFADNCAAEKKTECSKEKSECSAEKSGCSAKKAECTKEA